MKNTIKYQKHMNQDDRVVIEKGLDQSKSLKSIALELGKDPTTISKEIKKHRSFQEHNKFNDKPFRCMNYTSCTRKDLCEPHPVSCKKQCRNCPHCHVKCPDYIPFDYNCPLTDKAPYVCNGCPKKSGCRLNKYYYRATRAHREYKTILVESRAGINISEDDLKALDDIVSPLVKQGQSLYTIITNHPEITQCEKTLYNYVGSGALSVGNLDLPKKVKYKVRQVHDTEIDDTGIFENRTYKDFQSYILEYPDTSIVEMDTVVGCSGSHKVLLTLHFDCCSLMLACLLDSKESKYVEKSFDKIEKNLSTFIFAKTFPLIITDRGGEFKHPDKLECGIDNYIRTSIYYCDPMCSWQKPHCEKNHEYIRKICPKGTSFDNLTQFDVNLIMSHINSTPRESLGGLTPLKLAKMMLPDELLKMFNQREIKPDEVILTSKLLEDKISHRKNK